MATPLKDLVIPASLAASVYLLSLYLWRSIYPLSDLGALFLIPLCVMIFFGTLAPANDLYRARALAAVRPSSPYLNLLSGRLRAILISTAFIITFTPVLAWLALTAHPVEIIAYIALCLLSAAISWALQIRLCRHLRPPFARATGIAAGWLLTATPFVFIIGWVNFKYSSFFESVQTLDLASAVLLSLENLPDRRGWLAELFSVFYATEATKLWLAVRIEQAGRWPGILFSLDSALVAFIVARSFLSTVEFVRLSVGREPS